MVSDVGDQKFAMVHYSGTAYPMSVDDSGRQTETLDAVISRLHLDGVDILKSDTDGFDSRVLRGAEGLLKRWKPAIFFEYSPEHYEKIGRVEPMQCFSYLFSLGYKRIALYDSAGVLMYCVAADETSLLEQATRYALVTGAYYDILAFHEDARELGEGFLESERAFFPKFNRPYLPA
jgi:hypothetical protein